jgi:hypothetical protein
MNGTAAFPLEITDGSDATSNSARYKQPMNALATIICSLVKVTSASQADTTLKTGKRKEYAVSMVVVVLKPSPSAPAVS